MIKHPDALSLHPGFEERHLRLHVPPVQTSRGFNHFDSARLKSAASRLVERFVEAPPLLQVDMLCEDSAVLSG